MKIRQSGMPEQDYWESFFEPQLLIEQMLGQQKLSGDIVELGCGYGTFSIAAAMHTSGLVHSLDIEQSLIESLQLKAQQFGLDNLKPQLHDFVTEPLNLPAASQQHLMLYNLLHLEQPEKLLKVAHKVLASNGSISIIHWRSDIDTPRGPSLDIRPRPEQILQWLQQTGFTQVKQIKLSDSAPYHFGITAKPSS